MQCGFVAYGNAAEGRCMLKRRCRKVEIEEVAISKDDSALLPQANYFATFLSQGNELSFDCANCPCEQLSIRENAGATGKLTLLM